MAHTKSAKKRVRQNEKRRMRNRAIKSRMKTFTKKFLATLETKDPDAINQALNTAVKEIYKAASKGVIKKNTAARRVSKLMKKAHAVLSELSAGQQPSAQ